MKQKVVIKVTMCDPKKCRTKAMKIAATVSGVESVALKGDDKDEIEVIGDGIDTVGLAKLLRKNVGLADLLSVGPAKKEEKADENNNNEAPVLPPMVWANYPPYAPPYHVCEIRYPNDPGCSIM